MKPVKYLLLLLFFTGCNTQLTPEQKERIKKTSVKVSCFTPEGWVDHYTTDSNAFWRGGWSFYNLEGDKIESSMCERFIISKRKAK